MPDQPTQQPDEHVERYGVTAEEAAKQREAHASKSDEQLAYEAGRDAADDPTARRAGEQACPFSPIESPNERAAWFKGLGEALDEIPTTDELRAAVAKEAKKDG